MKDRSGRSSADLMAENLERLTPEEVDDWIDRVTTALKHDLDLSAQWKKHETRLRGVIANFAFGHLLPHEQRLHAKTRRLKDIIERMQ